MSGRLYGLAIVDTGGGPRQRPEAIGTLELDARPTPGLRGVLELRGRVGGPFEGGPGPAVYNFDQTFQNYSPALEIRQAFLEWRGSRAEVRAGIQTFAWGKLDGVPPTDVVNPRDWHDPLVVDEFFEEQKIGIPALLGTYALPDVPRLDLSGVRLALGWIPVRRPAAAAAPPRALVSSQHRAGSHLCVPSNSGVGQTPCRDDRLPVSVDLDTSNHAPARTLANGGIAARIGGSWRRLDFDLYHYTGPETAPDVALRAVRLQRDARRDHDQAARVRQPDADDPHDAHDGCRRGAAGRRLHAAGRGGMVPRSFLPPSRGGPARAARAARRIDHRGKAILRGDARQVPLGPLFPSLDSVEWGHRGRHRVARLPTRCCS